MLNDNDLLSMLARSIIDWDLFHCEDAPVEIGLYKHYLGRYFLVVGSCERSDDSDERRFDVIYIRIQGGQPKLYTCEYRDFLGYENYNDTTVKRFTLVEE